jgi:molybdenum cofactor cytidylyltransferase
VTPAEPRDGTLAVLLAAGGGTRFGGPLHKLLAVVARRPVWEWALEAAITADVGPVVVVTGCAELDLPAGVDRLHNPRWAEGLAGSLQLAVARARDLGAGAVVVGLGDQPCVGAESWRRVAASRADLAVATYAGTRGNPVRISAAAWPLLPTDGDEGARGILRSRPDLVAEVPCGGSPVDVDTVDDLARVERLLAAGH